MAHKMGDTAPEKTLRQAFSVFDTNGDGTISTAEIRNVIMEMGEPVEEADIERVLGSIDTDGDGSINYSEFSRVVCAEMKEGGYTLV